MQSLPFQRFWLNLIGLGNYQVRYIKVHPLSVTLEGAKRRHFVSFVGARVEAEIAMLVIFHTRKLHELDFLHEVIHAFYPDKDHDTIDPLCEELIAARKEGSAKEVIERNNLGLKL